MNYLGISKDKTSPVAKSLNILLANYHLYYQNLRNFHWNVEGQNFFDLHEKFEELYDDAHEKIDEIAERILTLRHRPLSRYSDYLSHGSIEEATFLHEDRMMVNTILESHRILIENIRKAIQAASSVGDEGTIDLLGSMLENLEKKSWMLDAWLVGKREMVIS